MTWRIKECNFFPILFSIFFFFRKIYSFRVWIKYFINSKFSYKDTRTVAVSEGSKIFLESLSLWGFLDDYAEPIKNINVYDRSSSNKIFFKNEIKNKKLGYVIENKKFSKILIHQLKKFKNTKCSTLRTKCATHWSCMCKCKSLFSGTCIAWYDIL